MLITPGSVQNERRTATDPRPPGPSHVVGDASCAQCIIFVLFFSRACYGPHVFLTVFDGASCRLCLGSFLDTGVYVSVSEVKPGV